MLFDQALFVSLDGYGLLIDKNTLQFYIILVKKYKEFLFMNTLIAGGILIEVGIAMGGIFLIKQFQKRETRQPALSKKIIKNLKF